MKCGIFRKKKIIRDILSYQKSLPIYLNIITNDKNDKITKGFWKKIDIHQLFLLSKYNDHFYYNIANQLARYNNFNLLQWLYVNTNIRGNHEILYYAIKYNDIYIINWYFLNHNFDYLLLKHKYILKINYYISKYASINTIEYLKKLIELKYTPEFMNQVIKRNDIDFLKYIIKQEKSLVSSISFIDVFIYCDLNIVDYLFRIYKPRLTNTYLFTAWKEGKYDIVGYLIKNEFYIPQYETIISFNTMRREDLKFAKMLFKLGIDIMDSLLEFKWDNEEIFIEYLECPFNNNREKIKKYILYHCLTKFNSTKLLVWYSKNIKDIGKIDEKELKKYVNIIIGKNLYNVMKYLVKKTNVISDNDVLDMLISGKIEMLYKIFEPKLCTDFLTQYSALLPLNICEYSKNSHIIWLLNTNIKLDYRQLFISSILYQKFNISKEIYYKHPFVIECPRIAIILSSIKYKIFIHYINMIKLDEKIANTCIETSIQYGRIKNYNWLSSNYKIETPSERTSNYKKVRRINLQKKYIKKMGLYTNFE